MTRRRGSTHHSRYSERYRGARRTRRQRVVVLMVLTVVLVVGATVLRSQVPSIGRAGFVVEQALGISNVDRNGWERVDVPVLYQTDAAWSAHPYANGTMELNGCGPTVMSMVYTGLTGKSDKDPIAMAEFSQENGFVEGGATRWAFMSEGAEGLGLDSRELPADAGRVRRAVENGSLVVCVVGPGDFTTTGHYIIITGFDGEGRAIIRDPNSSENTSKTWDPDRIIGQCKNIWEISA